MTITLHNLKPSPGSQHRRKRVGRGNGSGHGTMSGRGGKGQTARTGGSHGLKLKGLRTLLLRVPKLSGFTSPYRKPAIVKLSTLEKNFPDNATVNKEELLTKKLVPKTVFGVKILGSGAINKKLHIQGCQVSKSAKEAIEAAGGTVS